MSYKAIFELFLQINDFVNIDLPNQGLFRIRASVYQQQASQKTYGIPFQFMEDNKKSNANSKKIYLPQQVKPPYFYSKSGIIKYANQSVSLEDQIRFKLQVQSFPRLHSEKVFVEFQLIFQQCYYSSSIAQFEGKIVQSKKFQLDNLEHGILNYCQGQFGGNYSSKFSFTIFACLSNFMFGKYKLSQEIQAISKEDSEGNLKNYISKPVQEAKTKQIKRSQIKTFQEFIKWIQKYYNQKIPDPLQYFYEAYVKNLRYYFYLAQQKINSNSVIFRKIVLKVPKDFLELPSKQKQNKGKIVQTETQVFQKQFRKYMTDYEPKATAQSILTQINTIYFDIYMFLLEVQKQFQLDQLMRKKMKNQYETYIKQRYGERVFKSVVHDHDASMTSKQNRKIAKKMREKQKKIKTVMYPIQDVSFMEGKDILQFLFYEITNPKSQKKQFSQDLSAIKNKGQINQKQNSQKFSETQINNQSMKMIKQVIEQKLQGQNYLQKQLEQKEKKAIQTIINSKQKLSQVENKQTSLKIDSTQQKQKIKQYHLNSKQKQKQKQQNEDVYKNVSHQKGEVDSQLSQRSLDHQNGEQSQQMCQTFSGISDISIKNTKKRSQNTENIQYSQKNEQFLPQLQKIKYNEKDMLIVMCHGFQGSSYDMSLIMRGLKQLLPQASYLLSRCNEESTEGDIDEMGKRLSQQIQQYIRNYMDNQTVIINFVGHSMGGIIARAGIKYLSLSSSFMNFNRFGFFCTLSSPHLGYLNGVDGMIKAGLWAILKFKTILSLQQLTMNDQKQLRQTFMYKLSKQGSLKKFRKIILISSFEDNYVTWHSARISVHNNTKHKKTLFTQIQQQMVNNILGNQPIHRIDVNFNIKTNNLDSFIGRTAHINLIVQQSLFKMISTTIPDLFSI